MPFADEVEDGSALQTPNPLAESLRREANPWNSGDGAAAAYQEAAPVAATRQDSLLPPVSTPPATPWAAIQNPTFGPDDFAMGGMEQQAFPVGFMSLSQNGGCDHKGATGKFCPDCGAPTAKSKKLSQEPGAQTLNLGDEGHSATVAWDLGSKDGGTFADGLLWKVLCKTGTLALSPGPGQIDVEKPLELTPDLFMAAKAAFDEKAYEHVTIPTTHEGAHDVMANTGTVQVIDVLTKDKAMTDARLSQKAKDGIAGDPAETMYMLGGMDFTEPDVKGKAERGSILNCSVGFKFNVRPNKLTGKLYPVAIEHVALTPQPWVYGLPAFGAELSGVYDTDKDVPWDGVFLALPEGEEPPVVEEPETPAEEEPPAEQKPVDEPEEEEDPPPSDAADLSNNLKNGELSHMPDTPSLEQVLAEQQATIERNEAALAEANAKLASRDALLSATSDQLHATNVAKRIQELSFLPPALQTRYEAVALACAPSVEGTEGLKLSATISEGDTPETKEFGNVVEVLDWVLSALPVPEGFEPGSIVTAVHLAQRTQQDDKTTAQKTDDIERRVHPERFGDDGVRLSATDRAAKR